MRKLIFALVVVLAFAAIPVMAAEEPTAPITDISWRVYPYPQGINQACQETNADPYIFTTDDNVRFEVDIATESTPSEHWTLRVELATVEEVRNGRERLTRHWDLTWRHQNTGPGTLTDEVSQNNSYDLLPGVHRYTALAIGDASGRRLSATCTFTVQ